MEPLVQNLGPQTTMPHPQRGFSYPQATTTFRHPHPTAVTGAVPKYWQPNSGTTVQFQVPPQQHNPPSIPSRPPDPLPRQPQQQQQPAAPLRKIEPDKAFKEEVTILSDGTSSDGMQVDVSPRRNREELELLSKPTRQQAQPRPQNQEQQIPIKLLNSTIDKLVNAVENLQAKFETPAQRQRSASRAGEEEGGLERFRKYGRRTPTVDHRDPEVIDLAGDPPRLRERGTSASRHPDQRPRSGNYGDYWDRPRSSERRRNFDEDYRDYRGIGRGYGRDHDHYEGRGRSRSPEDEPGSMDPLSFDPVTRRYKQDTTQRSQVSAAQAMNNIPFSSANQSNSYMPGFQQAAPSAMPWMNQTAGIQDSHMDTSGIYEPAQDDPDLDLSMMTATEQLEQLIQAYQRQRHSNNTATRMRDRIIRMQKVIHNMREKQLRMRGAKRALMPIPAVPIPDETATIHHKQVEHVFLNQNMTANQVMRTFRNFFSRHRGSSATMNEALMMALPAEAKHQWQDLYHSMPTPEAVMQMMQRYCLDHTPADLRAELSSLTWSVTEGPFKVCMSKWEGLYHQLCMASYSLLDRDLKEKEKMNAIFHLIPAKWVRKLQSKQLKSQAKGKTLTTIECIQVIDRWRYEDYPETVALDKASSALSKLSVNGVSQKEISINALTSIQESGRERGRSRERRDRQHRSSAEKIRSKSRERMFTQAREDREKKQMEARLRAPSFDSSTDEIMRDLPSNQTKYWEDQAKRKKEDTSRKDYRSSSRERSKSDSRGRTPYRSTSGSSYKSSPTYQASQTHRADSSNTSDSYKRNSSDSYKRSADDKDSRARSSSRDPKIIHLPYRKNGYQMTRLRGSSKDGRITYAFHAELDMPKPEASSKKPSN